ncbi:MAG TPA: RsmF rRNA methyltransferase first C-terminal domain-containing protein, partial [Candidatus Aphodomorpha intestinavium]|nr:RsmF rRNA methyltransferase first C-terminal domain-containing protein [Candidatus Aphodomorpha intestinavium]
AAALRPGGRLVYSTCTFSPEENEETVAHFLRTHPDFSPVTMRRLYPHTSPGEGQFAALLVRGGGGAAQAVPPPSGRTPPPAFAAFCREALAAAPDAPARLLPDGRVFLLPRRLPPHMERLRVLAAGVEAGEIKNGRFVPAHALFLAYEKPMFRLAVELDGAPLAAFLAGEALPCAAPGAGYAAVCWRGHPLGFGKLAGGMLKNHLPKGLRLR